MNVYGILILILLAAVLILAWKLYKAHAWQASIEVSATSSDQLCTAREVPERLRSLFRTSYGPNRETDSEISVCFRYAKFHTILDTDQYPVDAKIIMHREAYLADRTIGDELRVLIDSLQKCGLEFVAVYGKQAAGTTRDFDKYLQQPDAFQHWTWKPSEDLKDRYATKLGRDSKGRFASVAKGA